VAKARRVPDSLRITDGRPQAEDSRDTPASLDGFYRLSGTAARLRSRAGGPLLDEFLRYLVQRRYARLSIRKYIDAADHLADWASRRGLPISRLDSAGLARFQSHLGRCRCTNDYRGGRADRSPATMQGARRLLEFLRASDRAPPEPEPQTPLVVAEFCEWMRLHRGTAQDTLSGYRRYLLPFVEELGEHPRRYTARAVREFVLKRAKGGSASVQTMVKALRMFLRCLISQDRCSADLDAAVPKIAHWRLATLPRFVGADDVDRIIATCPMEGAGLRNRAMLLLMARLALRAGDVRCMLVKDIDWESGCLRVTGKSGRAALLPLTQEVGDAVRRYIDHARPRSDLDTLFLRNHAPHTALGPGAIGGVVRHAILRSGVETPTLGAHLLRHSAAAEMLHQGASIPEIGAVLRHASSRTTAIYAKVDLVSLAAIAQPWPVSSC